MEVTTSEHYDINSGALDWLAPLRFAFEFVGLLPMLNQALLSLELTDTWQPTYCSKLYVVGGNCDHWIVPLPSGLLYPCKLDWLTELCSNCPVNHIVVILSHLPREREKSWEERYSYFTSTENSGIRTSMLKAGVFPNSSHAVHDLGRVRQYPPWLLFTAFVDSLGYPRYNPQKTRKQWRTRVRWFHWLWGWFPDLKIIFMM